MKNNAKKRNDPKSATDAECRIAAELLGIELGNQLCKP